MLTGDRNLDSVVLNKLDDIDLVNVCQTNKLANILCNDQTFWLHRIRTKFPYLGLDLLRKYKNKLRLSWSQYYITELRTITERNAQYMLTKASSTSRLDLVMISVNKGADVRKNSGIGISLGSAYGELEMVKYLHEHGADIDSHHLKEAKLNNHMDIVNYLISQGVRDN